MTLGQIIKEYRAANKVSQDVIAERSGLSKAYISILERNINPTTGEAPIASLKTINAIAKALESDFDTVFSRLDPDLKVSIGEQLPGSVAIKSEPSAPANKPSIQAAFWGGDRDLSQEDLDDMWNDVERFASFLAEQKKREKREKGDTNK